MNDIIYIYLHVINSNVLLKIVRSNPFFYNEIIADLNRISDNKKMTVFKLTSK